MTNIYQELKIEENTKIDIDLFIETFETLVKAKNLEVLREDSEKFDPMLKCIIDYEGKDEEVLEFIGIIREFH